MRVQRMSADHMTDTEAAWLAGLLEGEAAFDLHRARYPRIRVAMTDRDTVERVADLLGCKTRITLRPAPFKALWHAEVSGARAAAVMEIVLPHMGSRRSGVIAAALGHYQHGAGRSAPAGA